MGSGAFLVQAARVLAIALARARALKGDGLVTPERVQHAKREVVRHCLYGVDLNPLAVVLAKVSLWLETLEPGRPLSFLDAHLRCGDSLVGVNFLTEDGRFTAEELATFPVNAAKGLETYLKNEAGARGEPVLERLKGRKKPSTAAQPQLPGFDRTSVEAALEDLSAERERIATLEERAETLFDAQDAQAAFEELEAADDSIRNRLRRAADFWSAQWFAEGEDAPADEHGPVVPATFGQFDEAIAALVNGSRVPDRLVVLVEAAERVATQRRFFHWVLEFPEVLLERGGFDAVVGNPPWNETTPSDAEFFGTFDPTAFMKGVPKQRKLQRKHELRSNNEVDTLWRKEARGLHELSNYSKPESGRFDWYADDGQLRKGDANVFRLFVERSYRLLRHGGRLSQVLPDSVYVSSPALGLRRHLLEDGVLDRCWVFENRRKLFPIDSRVKVVLLASQRGGGPTNRFRAAFLTGKDAAGRDRAVGLDELPAVLSDLDDNAPVLTVEQIMALSPRTMAFPELQTALDAEIAAHCQAAVPPLNLDSRGWGLEYCREIDATNDSWRYKQVEDLRSLGAKREGLRWRGNDGTEWWPVVSGAHFYHLEFPVEGAEIRYWIAGSELRSIEARRAPDGASVMDHYRVAYRDVASSTNERSAIACVLPPRTVATNKAPTVAGGSLSDQDVLALAGLISSFVFDYNLRFRGATTLRYGVMNQVPAPPPDDLAEVSQLVAALLKGLQDFEELDVPVSDHVVGGDLWEFARVRARIDGIVALSYGLSLKQFAAVVASFPNLDRAQPMLPGEPKCFVTRDLALQAYCYLTECRDRDVAKLMREIGSGLPDPRPDYRDLEARIEAYRELGAVPYRPTPRGARTPTDPSVIEEVRAAVSDEPSTAAEIAELIGEEDAIVATILKQLKKEGEVFTEGRGKGTRFYRFEDD